MAALHSMWQVVDVTNQGRAANGSPPPRPLRIVIADDEPDTILTLAAILENEGHAAYGCGTGRDAVAAARRYKADVMIVDIVIPDMRGYDIARHVRDHLADMPLIIAISGRWKADTDRLLSVAVGFDHHLVKPCDPATLIRFLDDWSACRLSNG